MDPATSTMDWMSSMSPLRAHFGGPSSTTSSSASGSLALPTAAVELSTISFRALTMASTMANERPRSLPNLPFRVSQ
eukprot:1863156-Pyramimonas_sp.AAC.1